MSFVREIRRRKVFQVAAVYAVTAWLLVQVVTAVSEPLNLPDWADSLIIVLLAIGFPVALIMSWAYNLTAEGLVPEDGEPRTRAGGRGIEYVLIGLLILAVGWIGYRVEFGTSRGSSAAQIDILPNSIAVLPFENLSPDPENDYFAAGIHDEILSRLAKLKSLNVIARTSVMQYADVARPITEIAGELHVETIMEGSVSYADGRVAVRAQLIDAATGVHLWSETYNREFADIFGIQADIATNIANALRAEFSPVEQRGLEQAPTDSPQAYALYLNALTQAFVGDKAQAALDEALRIDPDFALAYAAKASVYGYAIINTAGSGAREDWLGLVDSATRNAERALALDPGLGLAHAVRGGVDEVLWRWTDARESFDRALELTPNDVTVLWPASWFRAFSGDFSGAVDLAEREVSIAPLVERSYIDLGVTNFYAGNLAAARDAYRDVLAINQNQLVAHQHLGLVEARLGNAAAAAEQFEFVERFFKGAPPIVFLPELAVGYARIARDGDAARLANQILAIAEQREIGVGTVAMAYLALGDEENLAMQLMLAIDRIAAHQPDQGFFSLMNIKHNLTGNPLLETPRFALLRERLGGY